MKHENDTLHPRRLYCPNCSEQLCGLEDHEGFMRMTCRRCHTVMVARQMGRRHDRIDLYAPKGQVRL